MSLDVLTIVQNIRKSHDNSAGALGSVMGVALSVMEVVWECHGSAINFFQKWTGNISESERYLRSVRGVIETC